MRIFKRKKKGFSNAKKCVHDGIVFDSIAEGRRYLYLKRLEKAGKIINLQTHVKFDLIPKQNKGKHFIPSVCSERVTVVRKTTYSPDFVYTKVSTMEKIANDFKGRCSESYKLKLKMFLHLYGGEYKFLETYDDKKRNNFIHF